jgi:hypothetical protein
VAHGRRQVVEYGGIFRYFQGAFYEASAASESDFMAPLMIIEALLLASCNDFIERCA